MAVRNLAAKMRIPAAAAAAARLCSAPLVPPASRARVFTFSSCSSSGSSSSNSSSLTCQSAKEYYLLQQERYVDATRELRRYRLELLWAERVTKLLTWAFRLIILPCGIGATCLRATGYRPIPE